MDIEKYYLETLQRTEKEYIDFWGINFTDAPEKELKLKTYQSGKISENTGHPLIKFLNERGMLMHFADVIDGSGKKQIRLDTSLYHRNDFNMEELFGYLQEKAQFLEVYIKDVKYLSRMKITDIENYNYAALYHVGVAEENGITNLVKFHFFTRWCADPNHFYKYGYHDEEYLEYVRSVDIIQYEMLASKAEYLLEKCGGHMWMIGMDISAQKRKYKIYLKDVNNIYQQLMDIVGVEGKKHLKEISEWNSIHKECRVAGIALALDTDNVSSVNLYYHVD